MRSQQLNKIQTSSCDEEPIHIPGSIQPHGLMLIADSQSGRVCGGAGDLEGRLANSWLGSDLANILSKPVPPIAEMDANRAGTPVVLGPVEGRHEIFLASMHRSGNWLLIELEPQDQEIVPAHTVLAELERAETVFEGEQELTALADRAAREFRRLTGYDRVMIYQFLEDGTGTVIAEAKDADLHSFLNHRFPASDIPRQARELYVRNRVRVIPDALYSPAAIRGDAPGLGEIDLSDCALRSVSPVHLTYLANMKVRASASVSIVKDGELWGLVACHNLEAKPIPLGTRLAARNLAGSFSRQVSAMEDTQSYRERLGQRNAQESILRDLGSSQDLASLLSRSGSMLRKALNADGLIVVHGDKDIFTDGHTPPVHKISRLICWASESSPLSTVHTDRLPELLPEFEEHLSIASGIVYARIDIDKPMHFLWLRAEQLQRVEWAGNPHKSDATGPSSALTPRGSFDAWTETVRGRSHPWTRGQIETATRISKSVGDAHQHLRTRALNSDLTLALRDNQILLQQKDDVLLEANHRIQNSLALVGAFLRMQVRSSDERPAAEVISEAQRRINAIGLVHRRLHQPDSAQRVDLARYLQELVEDMMKTGDSNWIDDFSFDLFPVDVSSGTAVGVGLILNELVTNVQKYAYGGSPGPVKITLRPAGDGFKLTVDDRGIGKDGSVRGGGFGTAIMKAMVQRIEATISEKDNRPGLSTTILAATGAIGLDKTLADE